jgi:hypothetical protein
MKQPTWPNRKPPVFVRCPVCGTEFWRTSAGQQWCSFDCVREGKRGAAREHQSSNRQMRFVVTPEGRFWGVANAARQHKVTRSTVLYRSRKGWPGWQFEAPYQIPAGFVPSGTPARKRGPGKREGRSRRRAGGPSPIA